MITRIFHDCWKYHMINVNVLRFEPNDHQVFVYTYFPYTPNHCEYIESTFLLSMGNHSKSIEKKRRKGSPKKPQPLKDFFPKKFQNFHKCPLLLATYTIPPYMILQKSGDGTYTTNGIEGNLFREMAASLNFHPMVRVSQGTY